MKTRASIVIVALFAACRSTDQGAARPEGDASMLALAAPAGEAKMTAHFIDVGQGLSALLEFPCGAVLIDAGGDEESENDLLAYLEGFFDRRPDLNRTIETIFVTHPHIDHTRAIPEVVQAFTVHNYVDDGKVESSGRHEVKWVRDNAHTGGRSIRVSEIDDADIVAIASSTSGITNESIDPVHCQTCDPKIQVLSGQLEDNPGWPAAEFKNANNHSLVIRVDFGESSFLFTGDLEEPAIETMVDYYLDPEFLGDKVSALDVDVYQVGHHGSYNGTTASLIDAMTPEMAVISCGNWDDGKDPARSFSTYAYGHPRGTLIELLEDGIDAQRASPVTAKVATAAKRFTNRTITDAIYATAWDGTVKVEAHLDGRIEVVQ